MSASLWKNLKLFGGWVWVGLPLLIAFSATITFAYLVYILANEVIESNVGDGTRFEIFL